MGVISVDSSGLAWLGVECERFAESAVSASPGVSGGLGATSAAVRALHAEVDAAARRIGDRLRSTGEAASTAGGTFALTEAANEVVLRGV
ncbi:MAG TPA: hypothetical protein VJR50_12025 [Mycobacterium sp.]|nr:hypothetical protein [Mycobacterium sp.]